MSAYDLFMLVVFAAAVLFGLWKGLAWQVASLAAIFASYFVAITFYGVLAPKISAEEPWNNFLAMFILYLGTSFAVWIAFGFVRKFLDELELKGFDRQAGAILGAAKGALLCIVITLFAVTLLGESWRKSICQSKSGYYIASAIDSLRAFVPEQYHETVDPYINNFNSAMVDHGDAEAKDVIGELIAIKPESADTNNSVQGNWESQPNNQPFDFNNAKSAFDTAREQLRFRDKR